MPNPGDIDGLFGSLANIVNSMLAGAGGSAGAGTGTGTTPPATTV
ncbi:hypothetical protein [Rhodococcus sp. NPDC058481]